MSDSDASRGLIDTSVVIGAERLEARRLPDEIAISAVTLAELSAGPLATSDSREMALRMRRLQLAEATFEVVPFDARCAREYGRVWSAVMASGRQPRSRVADLQIASTALAHGLSLYTRNPKDLVGLEDLIEIIAV